MDHDPSFPVARRKTIAGDMGAFVDDEYAVARFGERPADHCAAKACADNAVSHELRPIFALQEVNG